MKKPLSILVGLALFSAPLSALASFGQYRAVTVDHTKVPNTDQSNFPVLVNGVYSYLATVANGGKVQSSQGFDVGFYTSSDCSTGKMAWEQVGWSPTTGTVEYWVKNATLSHTTDTTFYMCYGDASITTDQSATTTVWDSNFVYVGHLSNGVTLNAVDSSQTGASMTNSGAVAIPGQIDGAAVLDQTADNRIIGPSSGPLNITGTAMTVSAWVDPVVNSSGNVIASKWNDTGSQYQWIFIAKSGALDFAIADSAATFDEADSAAPNLTLNSWQYVAGVKNGTGAGALQVYRNGSSVGSATSNKSMASKTGNFVIGNITNPNSLGWHGGIDEVRVSNIARSADWLTTEYNSAATSTFYTVGSETPIGAVSVVLPRLILAHGSLILVSGKLILN